MYQQKISNLENQLIEFDYEKERADYLSKEVTRLSAIAGNIDKEIAELRKSEKEKQKMIDAQNNLLDFDGVRIKDLEDKVRKKQEMIVRLNHSIDLQEAEVKNRELDIISLGYILDYVEEENEKLKEKVKELENKNFIAAEEGKDEENNQNK